MEMKTKCARVCSCVCIGFVHKTRKEYSSVLFELVVYATPEYQANFNAKYVQKINSITSFSIKFHSFEMNYLFLDSKMPFTWNKCEKKKFKFHPHEHII